MGFPLPFTLPLYPCFYFSLRCHPVMSALSQPSTSGRTLMHMENSFLPLRPTLLPLPRCPLKLRCHAAPQTRNMPAGIHNAPVRPHDDDDPLLHEVARSLNPVEVRCSVLDMHVVGEEYIRFKSMQDVRFRT
jgi:hypothetical protein